MVKVSLCFVPPGGGEADYSLDFDLPEIPRPGDYISITRADNEDPRTEDFIVRRTWWSLSYPNSNLAQSGESGEFGKATSIMVECEFAHGLFSSEEHKGACAGYDTRAALYGKNQPVKKFDTSCY